MKKVLMSLLILTLVAGSLFAGGKAEQTSDSKPANLQFFSWYATETDTYEDTFLAMVENSGKNINVEIEPVVWDQMHSLLQARIAVNTMPDLLDFKGQDIKTYGSEGQLMDLTGQAWLESVPASARENLKVDGKELSLPYSALFQGVFYNREIFAKYNISIPKTYAELMQAAAKLKAAGVTPFAAHFMDTWNVGNITMQFAMAEVFNTNPTWGDDLFAGKTTFQDTPGYRRVFEHVKDIMDYSWSDVFSVDFSTATARFGMGEAAMFVSGTWSNRNFREFPELDYGIFPFPGEKAGARLIFEPNHTWAVAANTAEPEAALAVMKMVAENKELAAILVDEAGAYSLLNGVMSSQPYPCDTDIDMYKANDSIIDVSIGNNQIKWAYQEEYSRYIIEWLLGNKTLDEALAEATEFRASLSK